MNQAPLCQNMSKIVGGWDSMKTKMSSLTIVVVTLNYYTRVEDGTYYGITHGGRAASTSLSGAYLKNYSSYGYEISWVDRSHQEGVQCAGIITLASLIFQLLPFVFFHT